MIELATPDSPESTRNFRRVLALLSYLANVGLAVPLLLRETDIGPNATDLLSWIVIGNCACILAAMGTKAWEAIKELQGRRAQALSPAGGPAQP